MSTKDLRMLGFTLQNKLLGIETIIHLYEENLTRHLPGLRTILDEAMGVARLLQVAGHDYEQREVPAADPVPDPVRVVMPNPALLL